MPQWHKSIKNSILFCGNYFLWIKVNLQKLEQAQFSCYMVNYPGCPEGSPCLKMGRVSFSSSSQSQMVMNELIEPGLNPPPPREGIFLSSIVLIVFNINFCIRREGTRIKVLFSPRGDIFVRCCCHCLQQKWPNQNTLFARMLLGLRHKDFVMLRSVKYSKYVQPAITIFDFKSVVCHL